MSVTNGMRPVHPGEILAEELQELGMSANAMARAGQSRLNLWCIMSIYRIDGPPEYQHFGTNLACPGVILGLAPAQFPVPSELRPRVLSAKTP